MIVLRRHLSLFELLYLLFRQFTHAPGNSLFVVFFIHCLCPHLAVRLLGVTFDIPNKLIDLIKLFF